MAGTFLFIDPSSPPRLPGPRKTLMSACKRAWSRARNRPMGRPSGKWTTMLQICVA